MLVSLCAETTKPIFEGDKSDSCRRKCISLSSVSYKWCNRGREGVVFKDVGPGFEQEGAAAGGGRRTGGATQSVRGKYKSFKGI